MSVKTRIDPIDRDIAVMFSEELSPQARSSLFAAFARDQIDEARQTNRKALGGEVPYSVYVDGREGAPLSTVKPDGVILAEWHFVTEALVWINTQLQLQSPVLSGRYAKSHELFADGVDTENPNNPPIAQEYVFINIQPYARKIEGDATRPPQSPQAPDGVYQAVAVLARQRFGNVVKVDFTYRTAISGSIVGGRAGDRSSMRNPAIVVRLRT